ncbi:MAG: hypothetical protein ACI90A_000682 [Shewanella sp.]|jgi:hypothetical protein
MDHDSAVQSNLAEAVIAIKALLWAEWGLAVTTKVFIFNGISNGIS